MIELTKENETLILSMQAKEKYINNKLSELRKNRQAEVLVADANHQKAMDTINGTYNPQIESLEADMATLNTELEEIK